jgi:hypothetical protein
MSITNIPGQSGGIYTQNISGTDGVAGLAGADKPKGAGVNTIDARSLIAKGASEETSGLPEPDPSTKQSVGVTKMAMVGLGEQDVGTDMYAVMALFQKMAQEMRNSAREVRTTEMQSQVASLKGAAQEIRNAAQDRFVGAIVAGSMQIVGGAVSMGAGIAGGAMQIKAGAKTMEAAKLDNQATNVAANNPGLSKADVKEIGAGLKSFSKMADAEASKLTGRGAQFTAIGQGGSGIAGGVGSIVQAAQERKAAGHEAKKAELEADAKVHESGVQHANDLMQQMMDVIRDVRDKLGSIEQSRVETTRGIARNI